MFNRFFQFESRKISRCFKESTFECKTKLDSLINSLECNEVTVADSELNQEWFENLTIVQISENVNEIAQR